MLSSEHGDPRIDSDDWTRLARYFAGEAPAQEAAETAAWIAATAARRKTVESLSKAWQSAGLRQGKRTIDTDAAWLRMRARMEAADAGARRDARTAAGFGHRRGPSLATALRLAAAIVLVVGTGVLWRAATRGKASSSPVVPERTFATQAGERRTIVLDDSSEVVLGVASRLVVAAAYGASARDMTLEGEALFRVRHDAGRPFRVHAGGAVTEDLGTEFAIRAYAGAPGTDTVRVVVTSGSVGVRQETAAAEAATVLQSGQSAIVSAAFPPAVVSDKDAARLVAFAHGELTFDDVPMSRVAEELERWYDVHVTLAGAGLPSRHLTAAFHGESLDEVLRVIGLSVGASVEHREREVTLRAAGRPR